MGRRNIGGSMRRDFNGLMISEECNWPGSVGDSCANTARSNILDYDGQYAPGANLSHFVTGKGFVRYDKLPADWMEDDFSDDQCLPLYMAATTAIRIAIRTRLPYFAGNGTPHNPLTYAIIWGHHKLANICLILQLLTMLYVKYRWTDANGLKWYQRIERSEGSSADWLNWFVTCVYLERKGELWFKPDVYKVANKVYDYYKNEPNNASVLADYQKGFDLWP